MVPAAHAQNDSRELFSREDIRSGRFIDIKDRVRADIIANSLGGTPLRAGIGRARVEDLVDNRPVIKNLFQMDDLKLSEARLEEQPWSDDYWAIYKGILGARYADPEYSFGKNWKKYFDYIQSNPVASLLSADEGLSKLSPGEKYDLLLGMNNSRLTDAGWRQGKSYFDQYGKVETWMGICHGWAAASYMLARPLNQVSVLAADGKTQINFTPTDMKSLASLLWAEAQAPTRFLGGRCNDKDPKVDENGRILSEACFDVNPGVWHMSVINQIGIAKRSMIIDATYDYEVWNQPMLSYQLVYFDPESKKEAKTAEKATILLADHSKDRYAKYRDPKATRIVGVKMTIEYMVETAPSNRPRDSETYDGVQNATYRYDLELDDNGNILGGEWHQSAHPDFLWTPPQDARALTAGDYHILNDDNWLGDRALNKSWREAGLASAQYGAPLARIVESLIELSREQRN